MKKMMNINTVHEILQKELKVFESLEDMEVTPDLFESWKTRIQKVSSIDFELVMENVKDIYLILKNWNTQVENLMETLMIDGSTVSSTMFPDYAFLIGLHCTHTDADGLGGFLPGTLVDMITYWDETIPNSFTLVSACAEYKSNILILLNAILFKMIFDQDPARFFITDIAMDLSTYQDLCKLYPNLQGVDKIDKSHYFDVSSDEFDFVYVDHHTTNPWIASTTVDCAGIFVAPTLKDFNKYHVTPKYESSEYLIYKEDTKISATYIMGLLMMDILEDVVWDSITPARETTAPRIANQVMDRFCALIRAISDWDTFEWRDHPSESYDEFEPTDIGNLGFTKSPVLCFNDVIKCIWYQADCALQYLRVFPDSIIDDMKTAKVVNKAVTNQCLGKGKWMAIPELPEIENWFVVGFPTIGIASMICHYIAQSENYKARNTVSSCGIIMLDLYSSTVSFRTTETSNTCRVDAIAKRYGGGGHPQASGCRNKDLSDLLKAKLLEQTC